MYEVGRIRKAAVCIMLLALMAAFLGCSSAGEDPAQSQGDLTVHFMDVGQGDALWIHTPAGQDMVIDAGGNSKGDEVVSYLSEHGVKRIDALVGTHPHEDHIGGLDAVIDSFDIGAVYMPKVAYSTKTYEDALTAIKEKGLKIKAAKAGMEIPLEGIQVEILAPSEDMDSDEMNDYSVVIRLIYKDTAFLFQGDAEVKTEKEILEAGYPVKADVIKLGHHGSSSSSSPEYIHAVNPQYAVIMLGKDNKYGHPHQETMDLLKKEGIPLYRTDEGGSLVAVSDGQKVSFQGGPGSYTQGD